MDVLEAISARCSVRSFRPDPVPGDLLHKLLEAAVRAPTGGLMQPWEFIVIEDPGVRRQLVENTYSGYYSGPGNPQNWILEAPLLLAACCDLRRTTTRYGPDGLKYAPLDVAAAIENLLLAAVRFGLGGCWVGGFREDQVESILGLPDDVKALGLLPIGYPTETPRPSPRLPLSYVTHRDRYGNRYYEAEAPDSPAASIDKFRGGL